MVNDDATMSHPSSNVRIIKKGYISTMKLNIMGIGEKTIQES